MLSHRKHRCDSSFWAILPGQQSLSLSRGHTTATLRAVHSERLHPHPSTPHPALHELTVDIDWASSLTLHYCLRGAVDALRIPGSAAAERTDGLWRHTCCELFVATPAVSGYLEFNFSPGGPWAAYCFDSYRSGMRPLDLEAPRIETQVAPTRADIRVELRLPMVLAGIAELRCALTAVIEERSGARSFWALAHPTAQPDFHHADGFTLHLSQTSR